MGFPERVQRIQGLLRSQGLDAAMFFSPANLAYIANFYPHTPWYPADLWRLAPVIVPSDGDPIIVGTTVSTKRLQDTCWIRDIRSYDEYTQDGPAFISKVLKEEGLAESRIGIEEQILVVRTMMELTAQVPGVKWADAAELMLEVRAVKEPQELDTMREAGEIIVKGMKAAIEAVKPGVLERDVAATAEHAMRVAGAERFTEETMVLSGWRTLFTRDRARGKTIEAGDTVILDMGCIHEGYCLDIARTVFCGTPKPDHRRVFELNVRVHQETLQKIRPGITGHELDGYARARYAASEFPNAHPAHLVGHGIGLEFHERPVIMMGNQGALEAGMTFACEPSIRVPGITGIRIENNVIVTGDGYEILDKEVPISFL